MVKQPLDPAVIRAALEESGRRRDSCYRSGRSPDWIKVKNPEAPAAIRLEVEQGGGAQSDRERGRLRFSIQPGQRAAFGQTITSARTPGPFTPERSPTP